MSRLHKHLIGITVAAFLARLLVGLTSPHVAGSLTPEYFGAAYRLGSGLGYSWIVEDTVKWQDVSRSLAEDGETLTPENRPAVDETKLRPFYARLPGYPLFLLAIYRVVGEPLTLWATLAQVLLTSAYPWLTHRLSMRLFSRPGVALAAAWMVALYPPLVFANVALLPAGLLTGAILLACTTWIDAIRLGGIRRYVWIGSLMALATYLHPVCTYLWIFLAGAQAVVQRQWRAPAIGAAVSAGVMYALLLPWAWRAHSQTGEWMWGSSLTGCSVWQGIGDYPNPWGIIRLDEYGYQVAADASFESRSTPEANRWFKQRVKEYVAENPGFFIKATLRRIPWALAAPYPVGYDNPYRDKDKGLFAYYLNREGLRPAQVMWKYPGYVFLAYFEQMAVMAISALCTLSMLSLVLFSRTHRQAAFLLAIVPAYFVAIHVPINVIPRYLTPIMPFQFIALAAASALVWQIWQRRRTAARAAIS